MVESSRLDELRGKWQKRSPETPDDIVECLHVFDTLKEVARRTPATYHRCWKLSQEAIKLGLMTPLARQFTRDTAKRSGIEKVRSGRLQSSASAQRPLPAKGKVNRYIFSCVQNNTSLHKPLFDNIKALLAHFSKQANADKVELHIARITYVHKGLGDVGNKDYVVGRKSHSGNLYDEKLTYPPECVKYFSDERVLIAPGLQFCGEVNILPTAERPLSGFESYTGRKSGIFPHTKVAVDSIASMPDEGTKFNYTTGALTVRNYIARKAGLKAEFHHCYGGLLVEVNSEGDWWCRQLVSDSDGTLYDIDVKVQDGKVVSGKFIDTVIWGDVHVAIGDPDVFNLCWGSGKESLLDRLRPKRQIVHDVLDFHSRSHHEIKNPMKMFQRFIEGEDNVQEEVVGVKKFLGDAERDWCETIVVNSNHDRHLGRWLNSEDARFDFVNVEFWSRLWVRCTRIIRDRGQPNFLKIALEEVGYAGKATILDQDQSFVVCADETGGIECGLHGDDGPNGTRGSPGAFARMGRKMVTAHTHRAGIVDGVYTVGTSSVLRPDYVAGPGAWSHTLCLVYENGKRTLMTIWENKERAR